MVIENIKRSLFIAISDGDNEYKLYSTYFIIDKYWI